MLSTVVMKVYDPLVLMYIWQPAWDMLPEISEGREVVQVPDEVLMPPAEALLLKSASIFI